MPKENSPLSRTSPNTAPNSDDLFEIGGVEAYLKDIGKVPVLDLAEEIELSKIMLAGQKARERLGNQNTKSDLSELQRTIQEGFEAERRLISSCLPLVVSIAKRYREVVNLPLLELIQEGNIGLIHAVKTYEYWRNIRLGTYATKIIKNAILKGMGETGRTIRLPMEKGRQVGKLLSLRQELTQRLGRDPSIEEFATALGVTQKKVRQLMLIASDATSLEDLTNEEGDTKTGELIPEDQLPVEEIVRGRLLGQKINTTLERALPPREKHLLQLRFGLNDNGSHSLEEVGQKMGVTRERVRQIEAQALGRLRRSTVKRELDN